MPSTYSHEHRQFNYAYPLQVLVYDEYLPLQLIFIPTLMACIFAFGSLSFGMGRFVSEVYLTRQSNIFQFQHRT
jgi:hypothetical protein